MRKTKWTYEICKEEALKYKTKQELRKNNETVFIKIHNKKWLELFNHMNTCKIWSYEECKEESLKYNTRKKFEENNPCAFNKIHNERWYELFNNMKTNNNWSYEKCKIEALKYNTVKELKENNNPLYITICKNKWYKLYEHMDFKTRLYHSYVECKEEALKYKTNKELKENNISVYNKIASEKWYELYKHMEPLGNKMNRLIYVYEFPNNYCYVGLTFNLNKRNDEHYTDNKSSVYKYMEETGLIPKLIQKTDFLPVKEASDMEGIILNEYKNNGWNPLNTNKTGVIGGNTIKWTYKKCKEEVLKYESIYELSKKSGGAYRQIIKNKWRDLINHLYKNKATI